MTRRGIVAMLLGLLILVVLGGAGLWLSQNLVQRREEVFTGYGETARRNPFYVAERWLTQLGRTVHSVRRLADLPETLAAADTVLVAIPTYALSAADSQRWLDWVNRGGHLIIGVRHDHEPGQGGDHLLNAGSVRSHRAESVATQPPVPVKLNDALPPLQVRFQSHLRLNDAFWQQLPWGQGRVTLLTDIELFDNGRLLDHDHADFLWALLQHNPGGQVWLQYGMLLPSLAQLLWRQAWLPLLGLALTLLTLLWHYSRRLGPLLIPRAGEQRRLTEHLHASSHFLWRHGAGPALLQAARQYTLRRLERRQAGAESLAAALADSDQPLSESALIHTLQTLQRLNHPR